MRQMVFSRLLYTARRECASTATQPRPTPRATRISAKSDADATTPKFKQSELNTYKIPQGRTLEILANAVGALLRGGTGIFVDGYSITSALESDKEGYLPFRTLGNERWTETNSKIASYKRPEKLIEIYEYEACPFCRKVREAVTILDLDVMFYPTPRGAPHHREKVKEIGGKQQYPFMVDPNNDVSMYESNDIVAYLFREYGSGNVPLAFKLGPITALTLGLCSLLRFGRGFNYREAKYPEKPLIFWGYEMSPFSKFVREALVELELPFHQISCARGSDKRKTLFEKVGAFQAPYIEDPNTGVSMFESDKILRYLEETYAV